jgi:hypothetical protein
MSLWKWFLDLFRGEVPAEHIGATEGWTPKEELPPDGPLPEEVEAREALAREQALIDAEDTPKFDETWDALVQTGVLTGVGADLDVDWKDWTRDDLTRERINQILKEDDEPTTDDIRISV